MNLPDAPLRVGISSSKPSLLVVVTAFAALCASWNAIRVGPFNVVDIALLVALVLAFFSLISQRLHLTIPIWMWLPTAGAALFLVRDVLILGRPLNRSAELLSSGTGASPLLIFSRIAIATIVLAIVIATIESRHRGRFVRSMLVWWVLGIVISSGFALLQSAGTAPQIFTLVQTVNPVRFPGLTSHPNSLAQTIGLALPILIYYVFHVAGFLKSLPVVGTMIAIAGLYSTGSRAGLLVGLGAAAAVFFLLILQTRFAPMIVPLLLVTIVAAILFGSLIFEGTRLSSSGPGAADSDLGRLRSLNFGLELFFESPVFGVGLGSWVGEAVPLILVTSGGLLFLPLYYAFLIAPLRSFWSLRKDSFYVAVAVSTLGLLAFGFLNNGFAERYIFWPVVVGFTLAASSTPYLPKLSRDAGSDDARISLR